MYHLNAEEEPEQPYWPKDDQAFLKAYHPRGVIRSVAGGRIEDTGPLTRKRMETIDDETTAAAIDFMKRQVQANKPFFTWMNLRLPADVRGVSAEPAPGELQRRGRRRQVDKVIDKSFRDRGIEK